MQWPSTPDPDLQGVCSAYAQVLELALNEKSSTKTDLPHECTNLFLSTSEDTSQPGSTGLKEGVFLPQVDGLALTAASAINTSDPIYHPSLNHSLPYQCNSLPIIQNTLGSQYPAAYPMINITTAVHNTSSVDSGSLEQSYDAATRQIIPILTFLLRAQTSSASRRGRTSKS